MKEKKALSKMHVKLGKLLKQMRKANDLPVKALKNHIDATELIEIEKGQRDIGVVEFLKLTLSYGINFRNFFNELLKGMPRSYVINVDDAEDFAEIRMEYDQRDPKNSMIEITTTDLDNGKIWVEDSLNGVTKIIHLILHLTLEEEAYRDKNIILTTHGIEYSKMHELAKVVSEALEKRTIEIYK